MRETRTYHVRTIIEIVLIVFILSLLITFFILHALFDHSRSVQQRTTLHQTETHATSSIPIVVATSTAPGITNSPTAPASAHATSSGATYIEVVNSCGIHYDGDPCLNARSGPGTQYPVVSKLRNGMVLKVGGQVEADGHTWYHVVFDEWLRYPERVTSDWYVAGDFVTVVQDSANTNASSASSSKYIVVNRSEQKLYAYDGQSLFMEIPISTGLELTPTPRGTFTIFKKTPSRYMQGPLPYLANNQYYDLPGVPWNLYFTQQGAVIHGAYWHNSFGHPYSHGCVNLSPENAQKLYNWADIGTKVIVTDA